MGGAGLDAFAQGLICEVFSKYNPAVAMSMAVHDNVCLNNLLRFGSEGQLNRLVPDMVSGKKVGAMGLTEPGAGSDAIGSMRTTATRVSDGYEINGTKLYITNGPIADVVLLYAMLLPERKVTAFIVEKGFEGFSVHQKLTKMGMRGSPTGELVFDKCVVPQENIVGDEGGGVTALMSGLDIERSIASFQCLGMAKRSLELAIEYSKQREQFGSPISNFQMIQAYIAEMYTSIGAAESFTYDVMRECCEAELSSNPNRKVRKRSAASMLFSADVCMDVADRALQIHGGSGYIWESEINRLYRAARFMKIGGGTSEIRKVVIANEILR